VQWLHLEFWRQNKCRLLHDNAPSHASFFTGNFWLNTTRLSSPTHPTCLTCPPPSNFSVTPIEDKIEMLLFWYK
jgi:hypothetical protein